MEYQAFRERREQTSVPLHPPPVQRSKCRSTVVTVFRVCVVLLSLTMLTLTIAGQIVPFCQWEEKKKIKTYSVWQKTETKVKKYKVEREMRDDNGAEKIFAILSAILSLIACIFCFVFLGLWCRHEQERRRESAQHRGARRYLEEMQTIDHRNNRSSDGAQRLESAAHDAERYGTGASLYARERERQRADRGVGIAAFSVLLAASVTSLITCAAMAAYFNEEVADEVDAKDGEAAYYMAGLPLFIAALVLGIAAALVLAMPFATGLYLCCPPSVEAVYAAPKLTRSDSEEREERHAAAMTGAGPAAVPYQDGYRKEVHNIHIHYPNSNNNSSNGNSGAGMGPYSPAEAYAAQPLRDERMMPSGPQQVYVNVPHFHNASSSSPPPAEPMYTSSAYVAVAQGSVSPATAKSAAPLPPPLAQSASPIEQRALALPQREQPESVPFSSHSSHPSSPPQQSPHPSDTRVPPRPSPPPAQYSPVDSTTRATTPPQTQRAEANAVAQVSAPPPSPQQQPYMPTMLGAYREAPSSPSGVWEQGTMRHTPAPAEGVRVAATTVSQQQQQQHPATQAAWRGGYDGAAASADGSQPKKKEDDDTDVAKSASAFDIPVKYV